MKPLHNCPYCGCALRKIHHTEKWFEKGCPDQCCLQYRQFYGGSFDDDTLMYIVFSTADFNIYAYFEHGAYNNLAIVYSRSELADKGKAGPVLKIPSDKIDTAFLENIESNGRYCNVGIGDWRARLNEKLKLYLLFS